MGENVAGGIQLACSSIVEPVPEHVVPTSSVHELRKWKILGELPELILGQVQYAIVARRDEDHEYHYAILVTRDDEAYVIGDNHGGQLGIDRSSSNILGLTYVKELSGLEIIGFSAGWSHVAAWTKSGKLYLMGKNGTGNLGQGHTLRIAGPQQIILRGLTTEKVVKAACGRLHTVCLTEAGNVHAWGSNARRQCSLRSDPCISSPQRVEFHRVGATSFLDVASSYDTCFALGDDGNVYAWGDNQFGQLGTKSPRKDASPVKIVIPGGAVVKQIACGEEHCLALTTDGAVYAWGKNEYGQIGKDLDRTGHPVKVSLPEVVTIAASNGLSTSIAQTAEGQVYAWGKFTIPSVPKAVPFPTINDFLAHENLGMCQTWVSSHDAHPEKEPNLQSYLWNAVYAKNVAFDVQGQLLLASKFCLKRCAILRDKLKNEWKEQLRNSESITIEGVSYLDFESFMNFLHTDELKANESQLPGLIQLSRDYNLEIFRAEVLNMIRSKIMPETALTYYTISVKNNDSALGLIALNCIKPKAADVLDHVDLEAVEPNIVLQLMKDIKAIGAFKPSNTI